MKFWFMCMKDCAVGSLRPFVVIVTAVRVIEYRYPFTPSHILDSKVMNKIKARHRLKPPDILVKMRC
jgi:hypothetical protein